MTWLSFFAAFFLFSFAVQINSVQAEEYLYAPETCEFQVTLPGAPHSAKRCLPENQNKCNDITSFTQVFGLDATVDIRITCNKAEENMYARYSGDVMKATLSAMTGKNQLDDYETNFQDHKNYKNAVIIGSGTSGNSNKIYMAQLWIGQKSVFTIEGELIGGPHEQADDMFADILRSVMAKGSSSAQKTGESSESEDENEEEQKPASEATPEKDTKK